MGISSFTDRVLASVRVPMRDGTTLATDIYFPEGGQHSGPYPTVFRRTPYGRRDGAELFTKPFTDAGYVMVLQDVRGRHDSDGQWYPYFNEGEDGHDSIEWIASQPWSDGNVGMAGGSYGGWVQWAAAREKPAALKAMASMVCCAQFTGEWPWINGILYPGAIAWNYFYSDRTNQEFSSLETFAGGKPTPFPGWNQRHSPLSDYHQGFGRHCQAAQDWLNNPVPSEYWQQGEIKDQDFKKIDIPTLHITGWWDGCQRSSHWLYEKMRQHSPAADKQKLIVGPWNHNVYAPVQSHDGFDFGDAAARSTVADHIRWFDHWLKGQDIALGQSAEVFTTGQNRWDDFSEFPPRQAEDQRWYLASNQSLSLQSESAAGNASYVHDPDNPVVTQNLEAPTDHPFLQRREINQRDDVLLFESSKLETDIAFAGRPTISLSASSSAQDTDWYAQIVDIAPCGSQLLVGNALLRARFRDGLDNEALLTPDQVYRFDFDFTPRSHQFKTGHKIGVAIASAGAPLWAVNGNGGGDIVNDAETVIATNTVYFGGETASWITLPLVELDNG